MNGLYHTDIESILSTQRCNGGEYWSTADGGIAKGGPFSTLECGLLLSALGVDRNTAEMKGIADQIFKNIKEDGRIKVYAAGTVYPCQTAAAARTLCYMGYQDDQRLQPVFQYFLKNQHDDGGWRCNATKFGKGPETEFSNPGPTLTILDVFRFTPYLNQNAQQDRAVDFLLSHWVSRAPLGPCHYGIGSLFMQVEFPMFRYNIFHYVYTLSFYEKALHDSRFMDAYAALTAKLVDNQIVVENPVRKLAGYSFCEKMRASDLATARYQEIVRNVRPAATAH